MRKINAIVLAAGYGTRLRPITDIIPKPLVPIGDRALLDIILTNLADAGTARFAVNSHHLPEQLETAVRASDWNDRVTLLRENEILGTGGPIINAKNMLSTSDAFILHNGDILTDANLADLVSAHFARPDTDVTMLLIDGPENKVAVDSSDAIVDILGKLGRENEGKRLLTYAGIAVFSKRIFDFLPSEPTNCSIITAILDLMRSTPTAVQAHVPARIQWNDLGTVERFISARRAVETGTLKLPSPLESRRGVQTPLSPLPLQGSDRLFIRSNRPDSNGTAVIMCAPGDNDNFARFAKIGSFLHTLKLGTPELFKVSEENQTLVMEDLGDETLLSIAKNSTTYDVERIYEKVLKWLVDFQTVTCDKLRVEGAEKEQPNNNDALPLRLFDLEYLLWESSYFADNYFSYLKGVPKSDLTTLAREFRKLADLALSHPQVMIHRDFQSSNIMLQKETVRIVDFQGARIGHIAYDLVSLLKDPYVRLPKEIRTRLQKRHFEIFADSPLPEALEKLSESNESEFMNPSKLSAAELRCETRFARFAATASLQRNMQALGAYVFLARKKRKTAYEKFIAPGAAILQETLNEFNNLFPENTMTHLSDLLTQYS